jgi:hypothetical protein
MTPCGSAPWVPLTAECQTGMQSGAGQDLAGPWGKQVSLLGLCSEIPRLVNIPQKAWPRELTAIPRIQGLPGQPVPYQGAANQP